MADKNDNSDLEGEGSYSGAKQYRDAQHKFAKSGDVEKKAREAADALEENSEQLESARKKAAQGPDR